MPPNSKETKLGSSNQEASPSVGKNTGIVLVPCNAWKIVPKSISSGVDISENPSCHLLWHEFSVRVTKLLQGLVSHELTLYLSVFKLFLTQWIMAILSKGCKPDNFEPHNSLKLSFTNIRGLRSNFVDCESFLESNSPDILALCETNLDDSIDSGNFSVRGYSYAVLQFIWKKDFLLHRISRRLCRFLLKISTSFTSLSVLLLFPLSMTFLVVMHGFLILFHLTLMRFWRLTDLLICLSLETLTSIIRTD